MPLPFKSLNLADVDWRVTLADVELSLMRIIPTNVLGNGSAHLHCLLVVLLIIEPIVVLGTGSTLFVLPACIIAFLIALIVAEPIVAWLDICVDVKGEVWAAVLL